MIQIHCEDGLSIKHFHGDSRQEFDLAKYDVVITTYKVIMW
jgi:replicative superfamily II helicase